jgi:L-asparaginase / beta-aspartyl-peptidase
MRRRIESCAVTDCLLTSAAAMKVSLVIHGGAGIRGDEQVPEALDGVTEAARRGRERLLAGATAMEVVIEAVCALEDNPHFNAGTGSVLTADGTIENDASVMWGADLTAGGVAVLSGFSHPVRVAEAVRVETPHVLLAGEGARRFALRNAFTPIDAGQMITAAQREKWLAETKRLAQSAAAAPPDKLGTVGAVACDAQGHVAAATSTGGLFFKMPGRVGDTPIIGAGTYADDGAGACSCTGKGEAILKASLAKTAVELLRAGRSAQDAATQAIAELGLRTDGEAGLILVTPKGDTGVAFNTVRMSRAVWTAGMPEPVAAIERG